MSSRADHRWRRSSIRTSRRPCFIGEQRRRAAGSHQPSRRIPVGAIGRANGEDNAPDRNAVHRRLRLCSNCAPAGRSGASNIQTRAIEWRRNGNRVRIRLHTGIMVSRSALDRPWESATSLPCNDQQSRVSRAGDPAGETGGGIQSPVFRRLLHFRRFRRRRPNASGSIGESVERSLCRRARRQRRTRRRHDRGRGALDRPGTANGTRPRRLGVQRDECLKPKPSLDVGPTS